MFLIPAIPMYCRMVYVLNEIPFQEKFLRHLPPVFESDRGGAVLVKKEKFCNTPALRFTPASVRPIIKYNKYNTGGWEVIITIVTGILHICIRTVYARMQWGARQIIVLQETAAPRQQKHLRSPMI